MDAPTLGPLGIFLTVTLSILGGAALGIWSFVRGAGKLDDLFSLGSAPSPSAASREVLLLNVLWRVRAYLEEATDPGARDACRDVEDVLAFVDDYKPPEGPVTSRCPLCHDARAQGIVRRAVANSLLVLEQGEPDCCAFHATGWEAVKQGLRHVRDSVERPEPTSMPSEGARRG